MKKKFLLTLVVCGMLLTGCGGGSSSMSDSQILSKLKEISNWYTSDIWNDGLCDMGYYAADGTSSTGQELDIEMTLKRYNESIEKLEEYNTFVTELDNDKYKDVKYAWDKLYEGIKTSNDIIQSNELTAKSGLDLKTGKLSQYSKAFKDYINELKDK